MLLILILILASAGVTAGLVSLQVVRYRKLSEHPWRDVFSHKASLVVYVILRMMVFFSLARAVVRQDAESAAYCIIVLLLLCLPMAMERKFRVEISPLMEIIIFLFIYAAEILGEVESYYTLFPGWDTALHTVNGFLCAAIGFSLIDMLNRSEDITLSLSPFFLALVAFCFSMTVGIVWEFMEFGADTFLGLDAQKDFIISGFQSVTLDDTKQQIPIAVHHIVNTVITTADGTQYVIDGGYLDIGLKDTMKDLIVNCVGALVFSVIGYIGLKVGHESKLARLFIPLVKRPRDFLKEQNVPEAPQQQNADAQMPV